MDAATWAKICLPAAKASTRWCCTHVSQICNTWQSGCGSTKHKYIGYYLACTFLPGSPDTRQRGGKLKEQNSREPKSPPEEQSKLLLGGEQKRASYNQAYASECKSTKKTCSDSLQSDFQQPYARHYAVNAELPSSHTPSDCCSMPSYNGILRSVYIHRIYIATRLVAALQGHRHIF